MELPFILSRVMTVLLDSHIFFMNVRLNIYLGRITKGLSVTVACVVAPLVVAPTAYSCTVSGASSRMVNYCLTQELSGKIVGIRQIQMVDYFQKREGYSNGLGLPGAIDNMSVQPYAFPVLDYSTNINGGNPDKPLELGTLTFAGDSNLLRKQGAIVGLGVGAKGRYIYGEGQYFDFFANGTYTRSIEYDLGIAQHSLSVCSKKNVDQTWFTDVCVTSARTTKELTDVEGQTASLSFARLFGSPGNSYHKANVGLKRSFEHSFTQNHLALGLDTIHQNGVFSAVSLTIGETIPETLATKFKIDANVGTTFFGQNLSLALSYSEARHGKILGFDQEEATSYFSIQYAFNPKFTLSLGYSNTNSNIDYFDRSEPSFGIQFSPIEF